MNWTVPKIWIGETVAILGGGPSLKPGDIEIVKAAGWRRIATNEAYRLDPRADVLCWGDQRWYLRNRHLIHAHTGTYKITWTELPDYPREIKLLRRVVGKHKVSGFSFDPGEIAGHSTGNGAINLAAHFGVARIVLLGFDLTTEHGFNWHEHHKKHASEGRMISLFIPEMEEAAKSVQQLGIEVVNCSLVSKLNAYPKAPLEEVVRGAVWSAR
jgi:hypothetical protein